MELFPYLVDLFIHLDRHLASIVQEYGWWSYALLALIIFAETGLVFTPFLPGDSLLFAAGALSATGALNVFFLFILLAFAAILGDTVNYWIGHRFGEYLLSRHTRWLRREHVDRTHAFFERYGGKTIIIARFVPIVRTFAPFVAGLGAMDYRRFIVYNVAGGLLWVVLCLGGGFFFGNLPVVRENFSLVILAIIVISILPGLVAWQGARREARRKAAATAERTVAPVKADAASTD